ncbi:efflux RND transporter permease subunit [Pelagibaculum spongiae]|uniref:SSD domain-containing protein n=1 Tax=Pelagibaculum spongiae TaxID=2080658 RepID=A0A2V1GNN1_9GAMM|nr:efflux RND transporter permease subunit [Pelagibaculum spongiae]PVZ63571.1 hypothetical protein DC094_21045 [Pelagibaculum spongiae]
MSDSQPAKTPKKNSGLKRYTTSETGLIAWFAENHVAANLLMLLIMVAGLIAVGSIRKQTFPDFDSRVVQVVIAYPGSAPEESEEGICLKIEESLQGLEGIKSINSSCYEGGATVNVESSQDFEVEELLDQVKLRVDAITSLPEQAEKPLIRKLQFGEATLWISVYGGENRKQRRAYAQQIRDEMAAVSGMGLVELVGDPQPEISIEVSEQTLRAYNLSFDEIAQAVRTGSVNLPGGSIRSEGGNILLRTKDQKYTAEEYADLTLRSFPDGSQLKLADIAQVKDGFSESDFFTYFNGKPASMLRVKKTGDQNELEVARLAREFISDKKLQLPDGIEVDYWGDISYYLNGRLEMMMENMVAGAALVFLILTLFLRLRIAFWVIVGIPICFLGSLWLLPLTPWPTTINMISLFGFILVLGIVVDDAIVIGESVYQQISEKGHTLDEVIRGAQKVAKPATFGVLTTMAAFAPILFVGGDAAPFFEAICMVVILCLFFSLVESKLILPAHLAQMKIQHRENREPNWLERIQDSVQARLQLFIERKYQPALEWSIKNRWLTLSIFFSMLIVTIGLVAGGTVRSQFFPDVPSDFIQVELQLEPGSSIQTRNQRLQQLELALNQVEERYEKQNSQQPELVKHQLTFASGETRGEMVVELTKPEQRSLDAVSFSKQWREQVGDLPSVKLLKFNASTNTGGGAALSFQLNGNNPQNLAQAATELEQRLKKYQGVFNITNSLSQGSREIQLKIKPSAESLGISSRDLGRQVRQAFYGEEIQRIQRGRDEIKIIVRYPAEQRKALTSLEGLRIRTSSGATVPFEEVAEISNGIGYSTISRVDRKRVATLEADVTALAEPNKIVETINQNFPQWLTENYPDIQFSLGGASMEEAKLMNRLAIAAMIALLLVFALIAIPLHSYSLPLIIMSVIPFGFVGAIVGHLIFDLSLSMMSIYGLVALGGVVVNDSLIMVDFITRARLDGQSLDQAIRQAGSQRFRAILLTSLTTFFGLAPIIMETSLQAQFVIPMATSLAFGILFATVITLFLIPCLYRIHEDFRHWIGSRGYLEQHSV